MLDTTTYLLAQNNESDPILRPEDPPLYDQDGVDADERSMTPARLIGGLISLALLADTGIYLVAAL